MSSPATSRRTVIAGGLSLIAAPAILRAQQLFTAYPFRLGIAAGDPAADGFVIWTRLAPDPLAPGGGMPMAPVEVAWEVWDDAERTARPVASGTAVARPELGHSVHVEVAGLRPDRVYRYRFNIGRERSSTGRARTLPLAGTANTALRFGVAGCQHYEDGLFTAFRHLADEDVAFVYHYGDYIYEYRDEPNPHDRNGVAEPLIREHIGQTLYSLDDYRRRYAQYKLDRDLQSAHAAAAWFSTFDDHEVANNWVSLIDPGDAPSEVFALRRAAAFQAWYEHMPVRRGAFPGPNGLVNHRRAAVGTLLDLHVLDTRQYRTDQPCEDGFKPRCPGWDDAQAQVLGAAQERWLGTALAQKRARWNALAQQVMVMPLDRRTDGDRQPAGEIRNMDSWGSYNVPRERFLGTLAGLGNAVVLTGDEHQNFAGELRRRDGEGDAVAVEFVSTSISSGGDGSDSRPGADRILAGNPFLRWSNDRRGYLLCDLTPERWQSQFRVVDRVSVADSPVRTAAAFAVAHGTPRLVPA